MLSSLPKVIADSGKWKHMRLTIFPAKLLNFFLWPWMINLFSRILLKIKVEIKVFSGAAKFIYPVGTVIFKSVVW